MFDWIVYLHYWYYWELYQSRTIEGFLFVCPPVPWPSFLSPYDLFHSYSLINIALTILRFLFFSFLFLLFWIFVRFLIWNSFSLHLLLLLHPPPASSYFFNTFMVRIWIEYSWKLYLLGCSILDYEKSKISSFSNCFVNTFSTETESIRCRVVKLYFGIILYLKFGIIFLN